MNNTFHLRFKTNKTYLFCLFAIFVPSMVFSQNQWFEVSCSATPKKVIVREYNYPEVITYTEEAGTHLFTHSDLSSTDFCSEIIPEIFVNDFIVNGDTVYFCGFYKSNTNEGCVGWFDYNNFFYGNNEYHFYHSFSTTSGYVAEFTHLTLVYKADRTIKLALVGETNGGLACVTEMLNTAGNTSWSYNTGESTNSTEIISQICATDHFVVTAGISNILYSTENIRIYDKSNMFGTIQNNLYAYSSNNTPPTTWVYDAPGGITPLYNDLFSIAASCELDYGVWSAIGKGVKTVVYDASAIAPISGLTPVYSIVNEFYVPGPPPVFLPLNYPSSLPDIRGMTYSASASTLAVLMNADFGPDFSSYNIVAEVSVPPTPNVWLSEYCCSDITSISLYNGDLSFIVGGGCTAFPNSKDMQSRSFNNTTPLCTNIVVRKNRNVYDFALKYEYVPFNVYESEFKFIEKISEENFENPVNNMCP